MPRRRTFIAHAVAGIVAWGGLGASARAAPPKPDPKWHAAALAMQRPVSYTHLVCFWFKGGQGLRMHPNVWHEGVFATRGRRSFYDEQGAVHARVSVNFATEFGSLLEMGLAPEA